MSRRALSELKVLVRRAGRVWNRLRGNLPGRGSGRMLDIFGTIYRENRWLNPETRSGSGSTAESTAPFRDEIPRTLRDLGARSLLDAPCGDFNWVRLVDLGSIRYIGVDIVPELIEANRKRYGSTRRFVCRDLTRDRLPRADAILCRDCLVHLSLPEVAAAVRNFRRSGATWLITTTFICQEVNTEIATGAWRPINFERPPFSFPPPHRLIDERNTADELAHRGRCLGVWRLAEISA